MSMNKMFGVVVVGIGTAGSVRIRDLLNPLPASASEVLKLKGFVSRRNLDHINDISQISLQEALESGEVHAAMICTENRNHEDSIRQFLEAEKHVLVEFPVALSAAKAKELFQLAEQKGKILHVEHIELLSEQYKQLKQEADGNEFMNGSLHFTGGYLDENRSGFPSFSGIARLTWLVDLFGDLTVISATLEKEKDYSKMTTYLETSNKRPLKWIEERAPGMKRGRKIKFCFKSHTLDTLPETPRGGVGAFMQDQNLFARKLLGHVSVEELTVEKKRILMCLELAEQIQELFDR